MKCKKSNYAAGTLLSFLLLPSLLFAQFEHKLTQHLIQDIRDGELDEFSHIEAAFVLSGVNDEDSLRYYVDWYDTLVERIRGYNFDPFDPVGSARKVFNYIRTTLYDEYELEATTMVDIVERRRYNCVSSTILYNLVCKDLGWTTAAFETPTHVYTIFSEFDKRVMVENTHPMGFNILQNLHVYSQYLAEFYPQNDVYKIGLDRLYAHENRQGRTITNTELLGLLAYNQAYFAMKKKNYEQAYQMVLVAQDFNRDSRSNVKFEISLYYQWGKRLFEQKRYPDAFEVLADGAYRYPDETGLLRNTRTAFVNTLRQNWRYKDWQLTRRIIREMMALNIADQAALDLLEQALVKWCKYFITRRKAEQAHEAIDLLEAHFAEVQEIANLKRDVARMN